MRSDFPTLQGLFVHPASIVLLRSCTRTGAWPACKAPMTLRACVLRRRQCARVVCCWSRDVTSALCSTLVPVAVPKAGVEVVTLYGRNVLDQHTLRRCPPGFAKSRPGTFRCVFCTRGSYASASGSHHCRVCPYGSTSNALRTGCGAFMLRRVPACGASHPADEPVC